MVYEYDESKVPTLQQEYTFFYIVFKYTSQ